MRNNFWAKASSFALAAAFVSQGAFAQTLTDQIVVTATKRTESVQDVPLAISAYSGDLLDKSGVSDLRELSIVSPSIIVVATQSEAVGVNARIRGVGTVGDNPGLQSSVGVFIDEVYRSRNSVALGDLGEIDAIEVARGPQGTVFGKNSSAGALIVRTKQPEYDLGGYLEYTRSNYNGNRVEGAVTGPIIDDVLAGRLNGFFENRDGFITDQFTGDDYNDRNQFGLRGQLLFDATDTLRFRFIGDYSERDEECCAATITTLGTATGIIDALTGGSQSALPTDPFARVTTITPGQGYQQDVEDWGLSLQGNWDLGFGEVVSITSYREFEIARSQDIDFSRADLIFRPEDGFTNGFESFTQEVRASGEIGAFDWLVGVFYSDEDVSLNDQITFGEDYEGALDLIIGGPLAGSALEGLFSLSSFTGLPAGSVFAGAGENDTFNTDSRSIAIFTSNSYDFTDRLGVTVGLRYTNEVNNFDADLNSSNDGCSGILAELADPAIPALAGLVGASTATLGCLINITPLGDTVISDRRVENEFTWDAKLTYAVTDNINFYGGAARGYKAGGYNLDRAGADPVVFGLFGPAMALTPITGDSLEFEEETVINYEAGFKTTFLGGNATFNATGFYATYDDYQLNTFNGINFVVENVEEVKSSGFELDFLARPVDGLFLQGGYTYANTRYGDDITSDLTSSNGQRLAGRRITLAPLHSITGAATVTQPLRDTDYEFFMNWNFRYSSDYNTGSDLDPEKVQDDFFIANASIGLTAMDERGVEIEAFVRNITNADILQVAFDTPIQTLSGFPQGTFSGFLGEPRTYGITARVKF